MREQAAVAAKEHAVKTRPLKVRPVKETRLKTRAAPKPDRAKVPRRQEVAKKVAPSAPERTRPEQAGRKTGSGTDAPPAPGAAELEAKKQGAAPGP
jgi:hypothetical protein